MNKNLIYLRFVAVVLIVNSHLGELYPVSSLGFGGHIGNSIFYFISGFGLTLSYNNNKISTLAWFWKRIVKIFFPVLFILFILNIGSWSKFVEVALNNLVWHSFDQLTFFLPVLLFLYLVFIPLQKLNDKLLSILVLFLLLLSGVNLYLKVSVTDIVDCNLPSSGILFSINALISFCLGILFSRRCSADETHRNVVLAICALVSVVMSQGVHKYLYIIGGWYISINFYLNFITLIALYLLFVEANISINKISLSVINLVSSSSLAIYLVHFQWIHIVSLMNMNFPYNEEI